MLTPTAHCVFTFNYHVLGVRKKPVVVKKRKVTVNADSTVAIPSARGTAEGESQGSGNLDAQVLQQQLQQQQEQMLKLQRLMKMSMRQKRKQWLGLTWCNAAV